jgi:hypothetical protein
VTNGKIIAFGLLTERDLEMLGPTFSRAWPVDEAPCFSQLLDAIDDADRRTRSQRPLITSPDGSSGSNPIGVGRR